MIRSERLYDGAVLRLVLDAPKANVLDAAMIGGITDALADVGEATKLLIFEGEGRHFSFGASVEAHQAARAADMLATFHAMFRKLASVGVPTCALVRGQCLGGALELASWCTTVIAEPTAKLGQPEIQLAVFPPMASVVLPWRAGGRAALDLCISGRAVTAEQGLRLGVVDSVSDDLEAAWAERFEATYARTSAAALRFAERAARSSLIAALERDLPRLERMYLDELMRTHDANEGIAAFLAKRRPDYQDR